MKRLNKRGFTLVELLATMVILGIIMVIAVPNVMGILNNSRNSAYVEDAKKLISLAEYKFRSDSSIMRPSVGKCTVLTLSYLDNSEFDNTPNKNGYYKRGSYVAIKNEGTASTAKYVYYVNLMEFLSADSPRYALNTDKLKGISLKTLDELNTLAPKDLVADDVTTHYITSGIPTAAADGIPYTSEIKIDGLCDLEAPPTAIYVKKN